MRENKAKDVILEFLSFLEYKIDNDALTMEELQEMARVVAERLPLQGTADDFAKFYGQSRSNVSMVINRKVFDKPKRRVYYSFNEFSKKVPKSWKGNMPDTDT